MNIQDRHITDDEGRILMLRGCNLGEKFLGASSGEADPKHGGEYSPADYPFPLEEAEDHFARLSSRGFTFIRLPLTWEALEHEGPGIYDEAYLAYLRKILLIAGKRGLSAFITPYQEGRQTGRAGFPPWVPERIGFDGGRLESAGHYAGSTLRTLFLPEMPLPRICLSKGQKPRTGSRNGIFRPWGIATGGSKTAPLLRAGVPWENPAGASSALKAWRVPAGLSPAPFKAWSPLQVMPRMTAAGALPDTGPLIPRGFPFLSRVMAVPGNRRGFGPMRGENPGFCGRIIFIFSGENRYVLPRIFLNPLFSALPAGCGN